MVSQGGCAGSGSLTAEGPAEVAALRLLPLRCLAAAGRFLLQRRMFCSVEGQERAAMLEQEAAQRGDATAWGCTHRSGHPSSRHPSL